MESLTRYSQSYDPLARSVKSFSWTTTMRKIAIQTGSKTRTIYIAEGAELRGLRRLAPKIAALERRAAERAGTAAVAHGFVHGRTA